MTKVSDIYEYLNKTAPFDTAAEWDNPGLMTGDFSAEVKKILVALDVTESEINEAVSNSAELIVSHHPLIFHPLKNVTAGSIVFAAVKNGINIISAHTNLDKAVDGVNDTLCRKLGMTFKKEDETVGDGFLNTGYLPFTESVTDTAKYISDSLNAAVNYNEGDRKVGKVAVCSGAGADLLKDAKSLGCDALITGDASYHDFLDAEELGITLFAAGHFETEVIITDVLAQKLKMEFPCLEVIISSRKCPVKTVVHNGI